MDECSQQEMAQGLTLGAFLILPVQRFPRYQLLLQDMIKHTPPTHCDRVELEAALAAVLKMCAAINDATRTSESFTALQKMERMFDVELLLTDKPNRVLKVRGNSCFVVVIVVIVLIFIQAEVDVQELMQPAVRAMGGTGKFVDRTVLVFDDMLVCVKKQHARDQGWHLEWKAEVSGERGTKFVEKWINSFGIHHHREVLFIFQAPIPMLQRLIWLSIVVLQIHRIRKSFAAH
jgi:hypothetical protein